MACTHDQYKCTNGVFYCLKCGAEIANPYAGKATPAPEETTPEPLKKATKRKRSETK